MGFWLLRALLACAGVSVGALLAMQLVQDRHGWLLGASTGLAGVAVTLLLVDAMRTERLLRWVAGAGEVSAPRGPGPHGELGYRVERALRARDDRTTTERQRLAQFLSAIEASPNGVLLIDGQDQIQWLNSMAAEHFGLDAARDLEQRVTNLVRAPAFVAHLQSGDFDNGVSFPSPRGGGTLTVLVRPYADSMKLVLSQDITERERNDAMRRDFVANVSHEIRSPLTVLSGFLVSLVNLPLTEVEKTRVLTLMRQQTERMQSLVQDLLTLAQIEGAARPHADHWVSVGGLMQQVQADALATDRERHRIEVVVASSAEISGVESELLSAVWNLVGNAMRYTPEAGLIRVSWEVRADGCGEFRVSDNGPGIPKEHLPRLTERFYRVDGSRSRETGGTGLGLAIVKHVVQRHGGELDIQSTVGQGSDFRIVLPAHRVRHWEESRRAEAA